MKYIYWFFISCLIIWEMDELKGIFGFSVVWQYLLAIMIIGYFAYLLDIQFDFLKMPGKVAHKKKQVNH